jgi:glycerol uptake facilitator-like aquaporin
VSQRRSAFLAEAVASALLLVAVIGSGVMAERLAPTNAALALLANSIATGCALVALIVTFGPLSGAHMNPLVSVAMAMRGDHAWRDVPGYVVAQIAGAIVGVFAVHAMFDMRILELSTKARPGLPLVFAEAVATFGLLTIVLRGSKDRPESVPLTVACYITAAYWFTSSTSFANPAVTAARALTDSFAGISPADVSGFVLGQCVGAAAAIAFDRTVSAA